MITSIKQKDLYENIPVGDLITKNYFTPHIVDIGLEEVLLYIPKLPVNISCEFDHLFKKRNNGDAIRTSQRVSEANKIITPKLLNEWTDLFYKLDPLSKQTAWLITPRLVNVYLLQLEKAIKEKGLNNIVEGRPFLKTKANQEGKIEAGLNKLYLSKLFTSIENHLKKALLSDRNAWKEFANWFLTNITVFAIEMVEKNFSREFLNSISKEQRIKILNAYLFKDNSLFIENYRYFVGIYVQELAEKIIQNIELTNPTMEELEIIFGLKETKGNKQCVEIPLKIDKSIASPSSRSLLEVGNCLLYYRFRDSLAKSDFTIPAGESWPTANLTTGNRKLMSIVQLRPDPVNIEPYLSSSETIAWQQRMKQNVIDMDDITADVMDIVATIWLRKASHPEDIVTVTADDILGFRGLKPQKNGAGRRGGYKGEWRRKIARHIEILANTWIVVTEMDVTEEIEGKKGRQRKRIKWQGESKAWVVENNFEQVTAKGKNSYVWRVRPGIIFSKFLFGAGRQTALISQKALVYHPINQQWEKRLTRYLSWQWRNRQRMGDYLVPFKIETLLNAANKKVSKHNPVQTKERLEKALDTLQDDHVITGWQYESVNEDMVGSKGWWNEWLNWKVIIEPPQDIMDHYGKIRKIMIKNTKTHPTGRHDRNGFMGQVIKKVRLKMGLSQMQAAEEIGVNQSTVSRVERGELTNGRTKYLIKKWLGRKITN
jgi:DNA-binding XRE family transcriptional regulator